MPSPKNKHYPVIVQWANEFPTNRMYLMSVNNGKSWEPATSEEVKEVVNHRIVFWNPNIKVS